MEARATESSDLAKLYTFAVWMIGDRAAGLERAAEVVRAAPGLGFVGWAKALLAPLSGPRPRQARGNERRDVLIALDELLRTDQTVTAGDHPQIKRDPRRLRVLQWELKRSCLFAVMRGVPVAPRATFVLIRLLGFSREQLVTLFAISENSVAINLQRAEKVLDNYLGARCQHTAHANPCRCETRLGVALERGFIGWPEHPDEMPETPVFTGPYSVGSLFGSLPGFVLDQAARDALGDGVSGPAAQRGPVS